MFTCQVKMRVNVYFYIILFIFPFHTCSRKYPVHGEVTAIKDVATQTNIEEVLSKNENGRYTRQIEHYELSFPHKLTYTGDFVSFEVPHFYEPNYGNLRKKRSLNDVDALHLGVHVNSRLHHVILWPSYELISPDLIIEIRDPENLKDTEFRDLYDKKLCHYNGKIKGERNSRAALSTCDGLVGHITIDNQRFFIEPLEDHEPNEAGHHLHVVYKRDTQEEFDDFAILFHKKNINRERKCRANAMDTENTTRHSSSTGEALSKRVSKNASDGQRYIETMIVCDKRFLEYHRDLNRERFVLTVFNMAADYLHDVSIGQQIELVLVRLLYLEKEEKDIDLNITHNAEKTLENFCKWQQKFNPPDGNPAHADIALLLTRLDLCYGTECDIFGQSYIGTPCRKNKNCAYCEDNGLELGLVIAHQVGHLLGASNDDPKISGCMSDDPTDKNPYIMSSNTNLSAIRWSPCSKDQIANVFSHGLADCLLDRPYPTPLIPKPILPGVVYDWTSQCQLIVPGSMACPTQESRALLCEELRCLKPINGNEDELLECFSLQKPPADGTKCGEDMWCFQGKCVKTGKRPETIDGDWSEWSDWSDCTRTCGRGISYALRKCNNPLPANGGRYCDGDKIRYKICHPEECPENSTSFRQQQCDAYNDMPDEESKNHTYKAFLNQEAPCALWCTDEEDENVEVDTVVKDGTRCRPGSKDVCVNGVCWKVGCDNMLHSLAVDDACGTCNGDGNGCKIIQDIFKEIGDKDYYTVAIFPVGVKQVKIEELAPSPNIIAITDRSEKHFYLNSKYMEQPDGVYKFGKVEGIYTHTAPNQEKLTIKGPLKEELAFKVLFLKKENVGYRFQYAEMNSEATEETKFHWELEEMEDCSRRCGGGTQIGRLRCVEQKTGLVSDTFCTDQEKPIQPIQHCNMNPCIIRWRTGKWSVCDACKGKPGVQKRGVECVQENPNPIGEAILVEDDRCPDPSPGTTRVCSSDKPCKGKRYVHYIPHSHLGDVWIKMQPKTIKKVQKRNEEISSESTTPNMTDGINETIDLGEIEISGTKSTLPLVCATAAHSEGANNTQIIDSSTTVVFPEAMVGVDENTMHLNSAGISTTPNSTAIKPPKESYVEDKLTGNASKIIIIPLKKTEFAPDKNVTFNDDRDLPDKKLEDLEEDKKKIKIYFGKGAKKLLKEVIINGRAREYLEQNKNTIKSTAIHIDQSKIHVTISMDNETSSPVPDTTSTS